MPNPYRKKLIEVALPLEDINREAAREKSIRHGHPSTLHLWWARRPLAACRAVLFASLVDDPSECVAELMGDAAKRKAAEKALAAQRKAWEARKVVFDKAVAAGVPKDSGFLTGSDLSAEALAKAEPTLEDILVETERERLFDIIRELVKWENSNDEAILFKARYEIARSIARDLGITVPGERKALQEFLIQHAPPVYDPFCGGGSIPLEAQRLGLEAHASDLNPVPVLITKALIEIPPKFAGKPPVNPESQRKFGASGSWKGLAGLAEDIRYYGEWIRDEAEKHIGHLYPKVAVIPEGKGGYRYATSEEITNQKSEIQNLTVIAWLWARTVASPNPAAKGAHVPLVRSFWLSTKAGKKVWVEPAADQITMTYRFEVRTGNGEPRVGTVSRNGGVCLLTGSPISLDYVRAEGKAGRLGMRLMAIAAEGPGRRIYLPPNDEHQRIAQTVEPLDAPESDLPKEALGFRVQNYGMTKHRHLFTNRQLLAMTTFCDLVGESRTKVGEDSGGDQARADAVAIYTAFAVDKAAAYSTSLTPWYTKEDRPSWMFGRQAISMTWDFAEVCPFAEIGGSFGKSVSIIADIVGSLPCNVREGVALASSATEMPLSPKVMVSTDPPYYDNVPYADLSDFFYVWLRRMLRPVFPDVLTTMLVPKSEELVADPFRHGGREGARAFFEEGMGRVFARMREATDDRYPTSIYYAFKQAEQEDGDVDEGDKLAAARTSTGWETFLQGLLNNGWQVDGTWPLRTERAGRMRDNASNALASSIVLVCRPRPKDAGVASRRDFLTALKRELPEALRNLQKGNIAPVDLAQAAIGPGMAVFSRYTRVIETDGSPMGVRTALAIINQSLDDVLAEQEGEFDVDTRWALAWFDQYGFTDGAYGQAETLSTAKNTSVSGMVEAGILAAKGGKVRLLKKRNSRRIGTRPRTIGSPSGSPRITSFARSTRANRPPPSCCGSWARWPKSRAT